MWTCAQNTTIDENNFTKDLLYPTKDTKDKFEQQKTLFISKWTDTSVCYTKRSHLDKKWWEFYRLHIKDVYVDNILSNSSGDTLLVLVTAFAAQYDDKGNIYDGRTFSFGAGITIDKSGQWKFNCNGNTEEIISPLIDAHEKQILQLRKLILSLGYFQKDVAQDKSFWRCLYERNNVH